MRQRGRGGVTLWTPRKGWPVEPPAFTTRREKAGERAHREEEKM